MGDDLIMLTCYGHSSRLPQGDLAYLAFRVVLQETLCDIELHLDLEEEPDRPPRTQEQRLHHACPRAIPTSKEHPWDFCLVV
jgi:hypothetical protein